MLSGGAVLLIASAIKGERTSLEISAVSSTSWLALGYLIVFGSLIGFTAYSWLLKNAAPAKVATYAYVNPLIAVLLGWAIAGESMTAQMLVGAAVVIGSVALVTSRSKPEIKPQQSAARRPGEARTGEFPAFSTH
jgi:drug/metabolite transporter (DMT)-like permease